MRVRSFLLVLCVPLLFSCASNAPDREPSQKAGELQSAEPEPSERLPSENAETHEVNPPVPFSMGRIEATVKTAKDIQYRLSILATWPACAWGRDSDGHTQFEGQELTPLRQSMDRLNAELDALEKSAENAGNAKAIETLANLHYAYAWLDDAWSAEAFSKPQKAKIYLRGVKAACAQAECLLNGKKRFDPDDPEASVIQVPKYIEAADAMD